MDINQNQSTSLLKTLLELSFNVAFNLKQSTITSEHVLLAILNGSLSTKNFLKSKGIAVDEMSKEVLAHIVSNSHLLKNKIADESRSTDATTVFGQLTSSTR